MTIKRTVSLLLLISGAVCAAENAQTLMTAAAAEAAANHRNVLVVFHASWCGWCKKFDAMLADPKVGPIMRKHFVIARIDVLERGDQVSLNTPGGEKVMEALGGKDSGLPFLAMADTKGQPIINSLEQPGGKNIGYPNQPDEIDWFMTMLKRSAPDLTPEDGATVKAWLQAHAT